jgi:hypothetical protein
MARRNYRVTIHEPILARALIIFSILSTVALVALASSCGLPTVTYLYPPDISVDKAALSVSNDPNNYDSSEGSSQTYKGIEIYYRVYTSSSAAASIIVTLNSLADSYGDEPDSFISAATGTYKFSRLRNTYSSTTPLIPIEADDASRYYIAFSSVSDWTLTDENGDSMNDGNGHDISKITRTLDSNPNSSSLSFYEKDFNVSASATDSDYAGSASASASDTLFFAVSYGIDQSTVGQIVFSAPYIASSYAEY